MTEPTGHAVTHDVTDQDYLRTKDTVDLLNLDYRLERSIKELTDYRRNVNAVLKARLHDGADQRG